MSSILRALRRLEAEARSDEEHEPSLHEHVVFSRGRGRARRNALALGALVVVVVCVGALGIAGLRLLVGGSGEPAIAAEPARSATTRPAAPRRAAPATGSELAPLAAEVSRPPPRVAAVAPPPRRAPVAAVQAPPPRAPAPVAPQPPVATDAPAAEPPAAASRRSADAPASRPGGAPTPAAAVAAPEPPSAAETDSAQTQTARASGAPVGVERILWHPSAEKRRAWLRVDGEETTREVREGEQVGRYAVTRIDAGSVLFRSGSIELTRKLGADRP